MSFESIALNLDIWIRFFEFCIWVTLFPGNKELAGGDKPGQSYITNVPRELQDYLIRRIFTKYQRLSENQSPRTILEDAVFDVMPRREVIRDFHALMGRSRSDDNHSSEEAILAARNTAILNLQKAWNKLSADMAKATRNLYASTRSA